MTYGIWKEKQRLELPRERKRRGPLVAGCLGCVLVSMVGWAAVFGVVWHPCESTGVTIVVPEPGKIIPVVEPAPVERCTDPVAEGEPQSLDDVLLSITWR